MNMVLISVFGDDMGVPKIRGTISGVSMIRVIAHWIHIGVLQFRESTTHPHINLDSISCSM